MRRPGLALAFLSLTALGGCAFATPFKGPGYDPGKGVTITDAETLLVVVTKAELGDDDAMRARFWDYVRKVEATLPERPGFVAYSKRAELFGDQAWTMTVWTDAASVEAFVASDVHQAAIGEAIGALRDARFARFEVDRAEVPVTWDRALTQLAAKSRSYE